MPTLEHRVLNGVKQIQNPINGKWVNASGEAGRKLIGNDICQLYPREKEFVPLEHQARVAKYFIESPYRGLLLSWSLGYGKSAGYAMVIDAYLLNPKNNKNVIIITSGSLRENFIHQYCSLAGKNTKDILRFMKFVSYNYTGILPKLPSLDNSLIVIDEIHNLLNAKVNGSEIISQLYDRIEQSKNTKIVVGSATPIVSHIEELYYLMRLIRPEAFYSLDHFLKQFELIDGVYFPVNEYLLLGRLRGVIDYLKPTEELSSSDYPRVTKLNIFVPISNYSRERLDRLIYWRNVEIQTPPPGDIKNRAHEAYRGARTRFFLATSMLKSRQASNFIYPVLEGAEELPGTSLKKTIPEEPKNRSKSDDLIERGGWIDMNILELLPNYGEKINAIVTDVLTSPGKHVIYSSFKTYYGEFLLCSIFDLLQIPYLVYDGSLDDGQRNETLANFNHKDNLHGDNYKVLIMTEAGSEGITLLAVRTQHILEQTISEYIIDQVMGRCNRYKSHADLDYEDRTLTIKRYFLDIQSTYPYLDNKEYSPDIIAYRRGQLKKRSISYLVETIIPQLRLGV